MKSQTQNCFPHPFLFFIHFLILHPFLFFILFSFSSFPLLHPFLFFIHFLILLSILLLTISILPFNFSIRYKSIGGEKRKGIEKNVFYYHSVLRKAAPNGDMRLHLS